MNAEKLSNRLERVAAFIPHGARLADIGSDHAYLPCNVIKKGIVNFAIAGEVVPGPYQSAKQQVELLQLAEFVHVRLGSGLEVIEKGEVNAITIAGMGGTLITSILEEGKSKLTGEERLILQPNISAISIRKWLVANDWALVAEEIIEEDGKIYEVLVAERGKSQRYSEAELLLGPFLMAHKNEVFRKKWTFELTQWKQILANMMSAVDTDALQNKKTEILKKIAIVEEELN
ncbi:tRNA (adenine(22)-N(1))-methyltransferase TrmK [Bacillus spongiae]|uniref:tRNA (Adenine(22)-N(1))-methyltransferase TrmK n=1 Tax=Bacillus spongiae TaxID=2683610 RepID=A0ABU8H943_9BACI